MGRPRLRSAEYNRVYQAAWARAKRKANPEAARAAVDKWRALNPEANKVAAAKAKEKGREKHLLYAKEYAQRNKPQRAANQMARHAAQLRRTPQWAEPETIAVFYERAADISKVTGEPYHVDHIIPLRGRWVSGLHVQDNLQVIAARENCRKSNQYVG